jgi:hypothetical protein
MPQEPCSVAICDRPSESRSLCHAHYMRWYTTGHVRADEPLKRYLRGLEAQFAEYVAHDGPTPSARPDLGPCWLWTGRINKMGYGVMSLENQPIYAHRWAYERSIGPIPDSLELDHLCRKPTCVNPTHLEPVTHRINTLRGESPPARFARRDSCSKGHGFTAENTFTRADNSRGCRTCDRERSRRSHLKRKARLA